MFTIVVFLFEQYMSGPEHRSRGQGGGNIPLHQVALAHNLYSFMADSNVLPKGPDNDSLYCLLFESTHSSESSMALLGWPSPLP